MNSSPQTTELFASERKDTLLHWVAIGSAVGVGGGLVATMMSGKAWPLLATAGVSAGMYWLYLHAVARGTGEAS